MQPLATDPLPTLPTEVIEEVIDQASDNSWSLRQLTLLCKSLLIRARLHLFTGIDICSVERMLSSREFLDSHPWVPPLVQRVTLRSHLDSGPESKSGNIPLIDMVPWHLLTRFPNVRTWRMEASARSYKSHLALHHSALLCYQIYGGHIKELELEDIPIRDVSHFVRLISAFSGLQHLTCYNIDLRNQHRSWEVLELEHPLPPLLPLPPTPSGPILPSTSLAAVSNKHSKALKIRYLLVSN